MLKRKAVAREAVALAGRCGDGRCRDRTGGVSEKSVMDAIWSINAVACRSASSYDNGYLPAVTCLRCSMVSDSVEPAVYSHSTVTRQVSAL